MGLSKEGLLLERILGGSPLVAVDVGAAKGVLPHFRPVEEVAEMFLFEPEPAAYEKLQNDLVQSGRTNVHVINTALSSTGGQRVLYVTSKNTGSSLLPPREGATDYIRESNIFPIREISIETRRLSDVLDEAKVAAIHVMKIDVQGGEIEVLHGIDETRGSSLLSVQSEIAMPGAYDNPDLDTKSTSAAHFKVVDDWMAKHGLVLLDLHPARATPVRNGDENEYHNKVFRTFRRAPSVRASLWEVEAFYFRREDLVLASEDAEDVRRLAACYAFHHFFAHAHRLADIAVRRGVLSLPDASAIQDALIEWHEIIANETLPARAERHVRRWVHGALTPKQASKLVAKFPGLRRFSTPS